MYTNIFNVNSLKLIVTFEQFIRNLYKIYTLNTYIELYCTYQTCTLNYNETYTLNLRCNIYIAIEFVL